MEAAREVMARSASTTTAGRMTNALRGIANITIVEGRRNVRKVGGLVEESPVLIDRREPPNFFAKSTLSVLLESIGNSDILFCSPI
jgi:hypothetical protein